MARRAIRRAHVDEFQEGIEEAPVAKVPREKKLASGKIQRIEAAGNTYIVLEFEEGTITLAPTDNRVQNRKIAVKALKALL
jgi:hypothetical protein